MNQQLEAELQYVQSRREEMETQNAQLQQKLEIAKTHEEKYFYTKLVNEQLNADFVLLEQRSIELLNYIALKEREWEQEPKQSDAGSTSEIDEEVADDTIFVDLKSPNTTKAAT